MKATSTAVLALAVLLGACGDSKKDTPAAPTATSLTNVKPKAAGAKDFAIQKAGSSIGFTMDAPKEKIRGEVKDAASGTFSVDPTDITKTTAKFVLDIKGLKIFQQAEEDGEFGEETLKDLQNEHAREWLEIGDCSNEKVEDKAKCEDMTKKNANVEFVIKKVETKTKDITKLKGDERKVMATVSGDFLLHQRKSEQTVEVELTFKMKGDEVESLHVKTVKPFSVDLDTHDVRPRDAFGILAAKTLEAVAPKVASKAEVTVEFDAKPS